MSNQISASEPQASATTQSPPSGAGFTPITSQAEFDRRLGEQIAQERAKFADYDELKAKAAKFDEVTEQSKTEQQKTLERAEQAERERDALRLEMLKHQAAVQVGLPAHLAGRLNGKNFEELVADAKSLAELLAPKPPAGPRPTTAQSGTTTGGSDWLRDRLRN